MVGGRAAKRTRLAGRGRTQRKLLMLGGSCGDRRELVEHAFVELVEVEDWRAGAGEVVGWGSCVENSFQRCAQLGV